MEEPSAILPTETAMDIWQDIEVKTVPSASEIGTEAFDASMVANMLKGSVKEPSKKKLSRSDSVESLHLSSFKASKIEEKAADNEKET